MLRSGAAVTRNPNAYHAGLELGDALAGVGPDLVFVFGTSHYGRDEELARGLHDALDRPGLLVVGNAGDGFYSTHDVSDRGVSALALRIGNETRLHVHHAIGISADTAACVGEVLERVASSVTDPSSALVFLQVDARADVVALERLLASERRWPIVGGLVSDLQGLGLHALFADRTRVVDGAVALVFEGPSAPRIHLANTFGAGPTSVVDDASGHVVRSIGGSRAVDFVEREAEQPLLLPTSSVALLTIVDGESSRVRGVAADYDDTAGHLTLYGKIERGERVRVSFADRDEMLADVRSLARSIRDEPFDVSSALVLSCNGRRMVLGDRAAEEVLALVDALGPVPLAGFPSFAELAPAGPVVPGCASAVHNMTYVLLTFPT